MKRAIVNLAAITALAAIAAVAVSVNATPFHDNPTTWVTVVVSRTTPDFVGFYGPFQSPKVAGEFCAHIPTPKYACTVKPVMPPVEWMRKGAR